MKKTWRGRVLAMLLVLALTVGLVPAALAADSSTPVTFKQVSNDTLGTPVRPDQAVGEGSPLTPSAIWIRPSGIMKQSTQCCVRA